VRTLIMREPALFGIAVGALLTCGVQFGLPIDQAQANALTGAIVAVVTWWVRSSVVSPATAVEIAQDAATKAVEIVDQTTAGAAGTVTAVGRTAVDVAVKGAVDTVGGVAGAAASAVTGLVSIGEH